MRGSQLMQDGITRMGRPQNASHARLNRFVDMDGELLARSLEAFTERQLPQLEQVAGYRTIFFGVDLKRGKATGITLWHTEAALRASEPAEEAARALALARAGGERGKGLVDRYALIMERRAETGVEDATYARLSRWEGLRPSLIGEALGQFEQLHLPELEDLPGFRGFMVGANWLLGNTLSVSLWDSKDALNGSLEWERGARTTSESLGGLQPRTVIADSYSVALAPELRNFRSRAGWGADNASQAA